MTAADHLDAPDWIAAAIRRADGVAPGDTAPAVPTDPGLFDALDDGVALVDADGRIVWANAALGCLTGLDPATLRARPLRELVPAPGTPLPGAGPGGDAGWMTTTGRDGAGAPMAVDVRVRLVALWPRRLALVTVRDAAPRQFMERTLRANSDLNEQLRRSQKIGALGRLAGGVAHDFNNVLTAILGSADLLSLMVKPEDPTWAEADAIKRAADRGAALTKRLLAFSRPHGAAAGVVDLREVVGQMEPVLSRLVLDKIVIRVTASHPSILVRADETSLNQIVLNLIVNARDAMPGGGTATIDMGVVEMSESLAPTLGIIPGRYAAMRVADTGQGMTAEVRKHLFEPFFTTKAAEQGTGLGLSIVYGIVKALGGAIEVESEVDHGATFTVYVPLVVNGA